MNINWALQTNKYSFSWPSNAVSDVAVSRRSITGDVRRMWRAPPTAWFATLQRHKDARSHRTDGERFNLKLLFVSHYGNLLVSFWLRRVIRWASIRGCETAFLAVALKMLRVGVRGRDGDTHVNVVIPRWLTTTVTEDDEGGIHEPYARSRRMNTQYTLCVVANVVQIEWHPPWTFEYVYKCRVRGADYCSECLHVRFRWQSNLLCSSNAVRAHPLPL